MPRKIGNVARSVLVNAPLPAATKSYTVISHSHIINTIMQELKANNFTVEHELYKCTKDAMQAVGKFVLDYEDDPDLKMMYSFVNSYNKTIKFGATFGAYIKDSDSFMVGNLGDWRRKHTGNADQETADKIAEQMAEAQTYYDSLKIAKQNMMNINISKKEFGSLLGIFYMNGWLSIDMVSLAVKEYNKPSYTYSTPKDNLWTCYNHLMVGLKQHPPSVWLQNQVAIHNYLSLQYKLEEFDTLEEGFDNTTIDDPDDLIGLNSPNSVDEDYGDPNQVDLEDSIAEAEEEDNTPVYDEDRIAERIREDEAAVAEVCDNDSNKDELILPLGTDDMNSCPEDTPQDLQQLPAEVIEEGEEKNGLLYIPIEEYPDAQLEDVIDYSVYDPSIQYCTVTEIIQESRLIALKPLVLEEPKEATVPEEPETPSTDVSFDLEEEEKEEVVEESALVVEGEESNTGLTEEVMQSLSKSVSVLFSTEDPQFEVEVSGEDYIINLESGESVVLPKSIVNS